MRIVLERKYFVVIMKETAKMTKRGHIKVAYVPVKEKDGFSTYEEAEKWARSNAKGKTYNIGVYWESS